MPKFATVEKYFASLPKPTRELMEEVRGAIRSSAPDAEECISYNIPAFKLEGMLVWYAAFENHIGFYPRVSAMEEFEEQLAKYKRAKGSVQFPIAKPMPLALIKKMVKFRVGENMARAGLKKIATPKKKS